MAKHPNQKLKLFCLYQILAHETDEDHPMTVSQLIQALAAGTSRPSARAFMTIWRPGALRVDIQHRRQLPGWFMAAGF